jgi:hypothetical protein
MMQVQENYLSSTLNIDVGFAEPKQDENQIPSKIPTSPTKITFHRNLPRSLEDEDSTKDQTMMSLLKTWRVPHTNDLFYKHARCTVTSKSRQHLIKLRTQVS